MPPFGTHRHARARNIVTVVCVLVMILGPQLIPAAGAATYTVSELWSRTLPAGIRSVDITGDGTKIAAGTENNRVYLYSQAGTALWNTALSGVATDTVNRTIITPTRVLAYSARTVYALDPTTGAILWSYINTTDTNPILGMSADSAGTNISYVTRDNTYFISSVGAFRGSIPRYGAGLNQSVSVSPDGVSVAVGDGDHVVAYKPAQIQIANPLNFSIVDVAQTGSGVVDYNVNLTVRTNTPFFDQFGDDWRSVEVYDDYEPATGFSNPLPFMVKVFDQTQHTIELWARMTIPTASNNTVYVVGNTTRIQALSDANTTFPFYEDFEGQTLLNTTRWASTDLDYTYPLNGKLSIQGNGAWRPTVDALISLYPNNTQYRDLVTFINISVSPAAESLSLGVSNMMGLDRHDSGGTAEGYGMLPSTTWYRYIVVAGARTDVDTLVPVTTAYRYVALQENNTATAMWNYTPGTSGYNLIGQYAAIPTITSFLHPFVQDIGGALANASVEEIIVAHVNLTGTTVTETILTTASKPPATWEEHWHYFDDYTDTVPQSVVFDSTGAWLGVSGKAHNKTPYSSITGFGVPYSYESVTGSPTAHVGIASAGAFAIEGRGSGIVDIIRLDGTRVGTYTAGGIINSVAASDNGLWTAAGSDDGKCYVFSKETSSSWTLLFSSDSESHVDAVDMTSDGLYTLTGRANGALTLYFAGVSTTAQYTFFIGKGGVPYVGAPVTISDGGVDGSTYTFLAAGTTDSIGSYSTTLNYGHYYKVLVGTHEEIIFTSSNQLVYHIYLPSDLPFTSTVSFTAEYNATTHTIWFSYFNTSVSDDATFRIYRNSDGALVFTCQSQYSWPLPFISNFTPDADHWNTSYRVTLDGTASGGGVQNTWVFWTKNGTTGIVGEYSWLPPGTDDYIRMVIGFFLLLVFGGVFSYVSGPTGAFVISVFAGGLVVFGLFPVSWGPTVILCVVWSVLGILSRTGGD